MVGKLAAIFSTDANDYACLWERSCLNSSRKSYALVQL